MIKISKTEWTGLEGLDEELLRELRPHAARVNMKATLHLEATIKRKLSGSRSGRTYKVSRTGQVHVASAPGEPPARMMGHLAQSIGHSDTSWFGSTVSQEVGPGLGHSPTDGSPDPSDSYARRLEFGGADSRGVIILPRPYMEPSVQEATPRMNAIFHEMGSR